MHVIDPFMSSVIYLVMYVVNLHLLPNYIIFIRYKHIIRNINLNLISVPSNVFSIPNLTTVTMYHSNINNNINNIDNNNNNNNNNLTNSMVYGTRRFNPAFTRALQ